MKNCLKIKLYINEIAFKIVNMPQPSNNKNFANDIIRVWNMLFFTKNWLRFIKRNMQIYIRTYVTITMYERPREISASNNFVPICYDKKLIVFFFWEKNKPHPR